MTANRCFRLLLLASGTMGCAATSPWPSYEAALRCHLDGKTTECDASYKKAIEIDPRTQGLHSSFATHLLLTGRAKEAEQEFAVEARNYPMFAVVGIGRLSGKGPGGPLADPAASTPPTPPPAGAPPAPPVVPPPPVRPAAPARGGVR